MKFNVIKHKWLFLSLSLILIAVSVYGLLAFGLKRGIDFTGGTLWQLSFEKEVSREELSAFVANELDIPDAVITQQEGTDGYNIRTKEMSEPEHQANLQKLEKEFGDVSELSFQAIGSSIGQELVSKALWAFFINLFAITLYVAYAFRKVSHPVSSWKYAFITLITLFHDGLIPVGMMAFLGHYLGIEIDANFIVAVLLVIGFSVHDTIVVFDRIRENIRRAAGKIEFGHLVNQSINETFARSFNTSFTLIIVLIALFFLGAASLKYFILTILVGTAVGTYSSIFVASPLLVLWHKKS